MVQNNGTGGYEGIKVGFPWKILVFSAVVFGFALFVFFGLQFGYANYLASREKALDQKINQLATVVSQQDQQQFISFYSQLVNLKAVLQKHYTGSGTFGLLEKYTLPSVYYTDAKIVPKDKTVQVVGKANTIDSFVQQLYAFDNAPDFNRKATVTQMGFDQGKVAFSMTLYPRDEVFGIIAASN